MAWMYEMGEEAESRLLLKPLWIGSWVTAADLAVDSRVLDLEQLSQMVSITSTSSSSSSSSSSSQWKPLISSASLLAVSSKGS